eukprot:TRINITY_DN10069_c0_g1_i2.p1 TRINITY_DN10069_c0_g1~~TRINITY_DN10069_c0_g1_i2.p1  ORF type:complete len:136 (+),score=37.41 TRINITY_DN10069_c0_g1_i2:61-408(+)
MCIRDRSTWGKRVIENDFKQRNDVISIYSSDSEGRKSPTNLGEFEEGQLKIEADNKDEIIQSDRMVEENSEKPSNLQKEDQNETSLNHQPSTLDVRSKDHNEVTFGFYQEPDAKI